MNLIKRLTYCETYLSSLLIVLIAAITYGPLIPRLGFYYDDWYLILSGLTRGSASIVDVFASDRPFMGIIYAGEYALLRNGPWVWHLWAFLLRLTGAFGLLWLLRMLWPERKTETTLITLLFLIYPGFLQQPVANTFQNHFMTYLLAIVSIALMVLAFKTRKPILRWIAYLLSLPLALGYMLIYEYFIGLEGLRVLCLWLISKDRANSTRLRLRWTALRFVPYALILIGFLIWRLLIFKSTRATTNVTSLASSYTREPLLAAARLLIETVKDIFELLLTGWFYPLYQLTYRAAYKEWAFSVFLAFLAVALAAAYYFIVNKKQPASLDSRESEEHWGRQIAFLGFTVTVVTLLPMILAGRDIHFDSQFDRYTLQSTIGVGMIVTGLLWAYVLKPARLVIAGFLIGISVITHFHNAVWYAELWKLQVQAWQQLSWRAPQIAPGTTLFLNLPEEYGAQEDYEIWAPANLIYYRKYSNLNLYADLLDQHSVDMMTAGKMAGRSMRTFSFIRDYRQILLLSIPSESACLHVIDGTDLWFQDTEEPMVRLAAPYSSVQWIITDRELVEPPPRIFGSPAAHTWCYYFEQAELSNQMQNWQKTIQLGQEALNAGYHPLDMKEWHPFLRAYVELQQYQEGLDFAAQINLVGFSELEPLCAAIVHTVDPGVDVQYVISTVCLDQ